MYYEVKLTGKHVLSDANHITKYFSNPFFSQFPFNINK